jgi:hypothetical protein
MAEPAAPAAPPVAAPVAAPLPTVPAAPPAAAPPSAPSMPPAATPVPPAPAKKSTWWYWACGGCGCLAILLLLGIGSCVYIGNQANEAVKEGVTQLEQQTSDDTGTTSASDAHVKSIRVGDVYDEAEQKITSERTEFAPDSPVIHMDADLAGVTTGAKITAKLIAVSVTDTEGNAISNYDVASVDYEAPNPEPGIHAKFTPPDKGWPVGDYVIELSVDGQKIQESQLTVKGG